MIKKGGANALPFLFLFISYDVKMRLVRQLTFSKISRMNFRVMKNVLFIDDPFVRSSTYG
jgi:hypothetical protein